MEAQVLGVLYASDTPLLPADVQRTLDGGLAYTTVTTILTRLHAKGLTRRIPVGRGYAYCPTQSEAQSVARQMHTLLAVGSDRGAVLAQFVDDLDSDDEQLLERLIEKRIETTSG